MTDTHPDTLTKEDSSSVMGVNTPSSTQSGPRLTTEDWKRANTVSDGSTASYYELPNGAKELQDLINYKNCNAQIGEILRAAYRYGEASHSDKLRDAKKIKFYAEAEIKRLLRL